MPRNTPAPIKLAKPFLKAVEAFLKRNSVSSAKDQAIALGVGGSTLRDWRAGRNRPTAETIAKVSTDMAAIDRFLSVCPCAR